MKKSLLSISILLLATLSYGQAPVPQKLDTIIVSSQSRLEALQVIQMTYTILGQSVTPMKTDEAINLKKALETVYQLLGTVAVKQPADKPKEVKQEAKK